MSAIEEFLDTVGKGASDLAKDEILNFFYWSADEGNEFTKKQKSKLNRYILKLATGEITVKQFRSNIDDIKTLTEMQILKMRIAEKTAAQRIVDGIQNLIIDNLLKFL